jgi:hypothetical protein
LKKILRHSIAVEQCEDFGKGSFQKQIGKDKLIKWNHESNYVSLAALRREKYKNK